MKLIKLSVILFSSLLLSLVLTACGGSNSGSKPNPVSEENVEVMAKDVAQVHQRLLEQEQLSGLTAEEWYKISGYKLFEILREDYGVDENALDDPKFLAVFKVLHAELHEQDGSVKRTIDALAIAQRMSQTFTQMENRR